MIKHLLALAFSAALVATTGCTDNTRAKQFGGTAVENLPQGTKLVTVTWKEPDSLWILTRPMRAGEVAESYEFNESSGFGIIQGKVILRESK
jgi:hypothetical protein